MKFSQSLKIIDCPINNYLHKVLTTKKSGEVVKKNNDFFIFILYVKNNL